MGSEIELEPCAREYLLMKRGLYYRPDNMGYTGFREYAGRYLESDACPDDGVTAIHEDDAPEYSPACYDDLKIKRLQEQRGAQSTRIKELEEALRRLEQANNALCAKRSQATYDSMTLADGATEELHALDEARRHARQLLPTDSGRG